MPDLVIKLIMFKVPIQGCTSINVWLCHVFFPMQIIDLTFFSLSFFSGLCENNTEALANTEPVLLLWPTGLIEMQIVLAWIILVTMFTIPWTKQAPQEANCLDSVTAKLSLGGPCHESGIFHTAVDVALVTAQQRPGHQAVVYLGDSWHVILVRVTKLTNLK